MRFAAWLSLILGAYAVVGVTIWSNSKIASSIGVKDGDFDPTDDHDVMSTSDDNAVGTLVFHRGPNVGLGNTVVVHWQAFENESIDCTIHGVATGG